MSDYKHIIDFIVTNEGMRLFPYYPGMGGSQLVSKYTTYEIFKSNYSKFLSIAGRSGVTISAGIDVGSRDASDPIFALILDTTKRELLKTACGKTHDNALDWLWTNQNTFGKLSSTEAYNLIKYDISNVRIPAIRRKVKSFDTLSNNIQIAIADISMNGPGHPYFINALPYVNSGDYTGLASYVMGVTYISLNRRNKLRDLILSVDPNSNISNSVILSDRNMDEYIVPQKPQNQSPNYIKGLAIGNEIILSNYSASEKSKEFFREIFTRSGLDNIEINSLLSGLGVSDSNISKYLSSNNITLTNEKCEKLLYNLLGEHRIRASNNMSLSFKDHPREVNTAIISLIYDIGLGEPEIIREVSNKISAYLVTKEYNKIAEVIEKLGEGQIESVKFKRINEARLIRLRKSDIPSYGEENGTNVDDTYLNGKDDELDSAVYSSRGNLNNIRKPKNSTVNSTRDEIYQEITKDVSNSFADLLEKQQIITDKYMSGLDSEYSIRLKTINLFTNLTRNQNITYFQVEKNLEENQNTNINQLRLNTAYSMFPYGEGLYSDIRVNAINRAKYRIRSLESLLLLEHAKLIENGIVDFSSVEGPHIEISAKLINEAKNLGNLKRDLSYYNRSTSSQ